MRHLSQLRIPVLFLSILAFAVHGYAADIGAKSLDAAWMKAMKANDLEAVLACYASDAVVWLPGSPEASGEKAIRAAYQGLFTANSVQDVAVTDTHYKASGSLSVGWGHFSMTLAPKSGGASGDHEGSLYRGSRPAARSLGLHCGSRFGGSTRESIEQLTDRMRS